MPSCSARPLKFDVAPTASFRDPGNELLPQDGPYLSTRTQGRGELSDLVDHSVERLQAIGGVRLLGQPKDRVAANFFVVEGQDPETLLDEREIVVRAGKLATEPRLPITGV